MKYKRLVQDKLKEIGFNHAEIINSHIHLPELNPEMVTRARESASHSMIPKDIAFKTIELLDPASFHRRNSRFTGGAILLPIESHNIHGRASSIYCSNDRVLRLAKQYPDFFIPFASIDMISNDAPTQIHELHKRGIFGVKYHALEGYSLLDERCIPALTTLERVGLPLTIHLGDTPFEGVNLTYADPILLITLAERHPKLRIMATHFATPLHFKLFWIASRYENIYLDIAEFPIYWRSYEENPYGGLLNPLNTHRIGLHRFVYGTDFPMPTLHRIKSGHIEVGLHDTAEYLYEFLSLPDTYLSKEEKQQILCENVWQFLGTTKANVRTHNKTGLKI